MRRPSRHAQGDPKAHPRPTAIITSLIPAVLCALAAAQSPAAPEPEPAPTESTPKPTQPDTTKPDTSKPDSTKPAPTPGRVALRPPAKTDADAAERAAEQITAPRQAATPTHTNTTPPPTSNADIDLRAGIDRARITGADDNAGPIDLDAGPSSSYRKRIINGEEILILEDEYDPRRASFIDGDTSLELYDLILNYDALEVGQVTLSVAGGVRAIRAGFTSAANPAETDRTSETIPVVGGGLHWNIDPAVSLGGRAATRPDTNGGNMLDFTAEASFRVRHNVSLITGYQLLQTDFDRGGQTDSIDQSGLFANLRIEF